jgi:Spy/CpxP family protein refolding chaperone
MEEKLKKIIEEHEILLEKYNQERGERIAKMNFLNEHKFFHELQHLRTQKDAINDIFYDYRNAIEELRKMLNDWNS